MSAVRKPDIKARYQWLLDLLEAEFPGKIKVGAGDYDSTLKIAFIKEGPGNRPLIAEAVVERIWFDGGFEITESYLDGGTITSHEGRHARYSLNDDPDRDVKVQRIFEAFRRVAHA